MVHITLFYTLLPIMDKRGKLQSDPFTYRLTKDGKLIVYRGNKQIKIISGRKADDFAMMVRSSDEIEIQLALAKLTGHYKH